MGRKRVEQKRRIEKHALVKRLQGLAQRLPSCRAWTQQLAHASDRCG
jgi:hypothetical protein